jgi:hypothetical protein
MTFLSLDKFITNSNHYHYHYHLGWFAIVHW